MTLSGKIGDSANEYLTQTFLGKELIFNSFYDTLIHKNTMIYVERVIMTERSIVNLTITMTKEERKALKQIALDKDMTVSALFRKRLKDYQRWEGVEK